MTNEEYIEMAVAAGIIPWTKHEHVGGNNFSASDEGLDGDLASLIQFAKLVAAKERDECAKRAAIALLGTLKTTSERVLKAILARGEA